MNSPFVVEQARNLVRRTQVEGQKDPETKIQALYRLVYGRTAEPEEVSMGLRFLQNAEKADTQLTPWEQYAQVLFEANEFVFVD
jgi:hypothetical protein